MELISVTITFDLIRKGRGMKQKANDDHGEKTVSMRRKGLPYARRQ
jgi:hypothetical protein